MSLIEIWKSNKSSLETKHYQQLVALAGDGRIRDGSETSRELREFLALVPDESLDIYARECLEKSFDGSGLALQDIVNEAGRRLGFEVEDGLYRGRKGESGHDGLWVTSGEHAIVVEVKTTDTYNINLDSIAGYRKAITNSGNYDSSSLLLVLGRKDTGSLEAQIRGSRYAWDMRIISVDGLMRLMKLRASVDHPHTLERIARILIPQEFTRVDGIIDLVFDTAQEAITDDTSEEPGTVPTEPANENKPKFTPSSFHSDCADRLASICAVVLNRESKTFYSTADKTTRFWVVVSKEHGEAPSAKYWFAMHPYQLERLQSADTGMVALGCGSAKKILLIPLAVIEEHLDQTWTTVRDDRMYWHIKIEQRAGSHYWALGKESDNLLLDEFLVRPPE